jgi:hypothetical protein
LFYNADGFTSRLMTKTVGKLHTIKGKSGSAYGLGLDFVTLFVPELRIINLHTSAFLILCLNAITLRRQQFLLEAALSAWWCVYLLPVLGSCYNQVCNCCCPSCRSSQHAMSPACTDPQYASAQGPEVSSAKSRTKYSSYSTGHFTLSRRECHESLAARRGTHPQSQRSIYL